MPKEVIQQKQLRPFVNGHNIYRAEESTGSPRITAAKSEELGAPNILGVDVEEINSDITLRIREQGSLYPYLAIFKDYSYDLEEAALPTSLSTLDMVSSFANFVFPVIKKEEIGDPKPTIWRNYVMDKAGVTSIGWNFNVDGPSTINISLQGSSYKIFKDSAILVERHAAVTAGAVTPEQTPTKVIRVIAEGPEEIAGEDITDVCSVGTGTIAVGTFNGETPTMVTVVYSYEQTTGDPALFYGRVLSETVEAEGVDSLTVTHNVTNIIGVRTTAGVIVAGPWTIDSGDPKTITGGTVVAETSYVVNYITADEPAGLLRQATKGKIKIYMAESYATKGGRLRGVSSVAANWGLNSDSRQELGSEDPYLTIANLPAEITVDLSLDETEDIDTFLAKIIDVGEDDPLIDLKNINHDMNLYVEVIGLDESGDEEVKLVYKFPRLMLTSTSSSLALGGTVNRPLSFTSDDVIITTNTELSGL